MPIGKWMILTTIKNDKNFGLFWIKICCNMLKQVIQIAKNVIQKLKIVGRLKNGSFTASFLYFIFCQLTVSNCSCLWLDSNRVLWCWKWSLYQLCQFHRDFLEAANSIFSFIVEAFSEEFHVKVFVFPIVKPFSIFFLQQTRINLEEGGTEPCWPTW